MEPNTYANVAQSVEHLLGKEILAPKKFNKNCPFWAYADVA